MFSINYVVINGEAGAIFHSVSNKQNKLPICRRFKKTWQQTSSLFVVEFYNRLVINNLQESYKTNF